MLAMSQNNNNDAAFGVGLVVAVIAVMAYVAFALIAFLTFILTLLCFAAWSSPITIGKWTLTPVEARTFVWRGVFGACALTSFCLFVELFFRVGINWDALPVILAAGYIGGSLGVEWLMAQDETQTPVQPQLPTVQEIQPPRKALPPRREPFEFASWDDEEEQK
jgi:hypothetical protein